MKIICPHCAVENELSGHDLNCAKCKQTLKGHTYKKKTAILVTALVFVAGGVGGQLSEGLWEQVRYPVKVEYGVMANCVVESRRGIYRGIYKDIDIYRNIYKDIDIDICACALEKTMNKFTSEKEVYDNSKFRKYFEASYNKCAR